MKNDAKWLFFGIAAVLILIGVLAIMTETHTGYVRFQGLRTLTGNDAVWFGKTCLLLAVLPLLTWLPKRWVGIGVSAWWVTLMAWLFVPFLYR